MYIAQTTFAVKKESCGQASEGNHILKPILPLTK
jgi:hypothetical protein